MFYVNSEKANFMEFLDICGRFYWWVVMPFIFILVHSPCRRYWSMYDLRLPCTFLLTLLWWKSALDGGFRECSFSSTSITRCFLSTIVVEPQQKYHYPSIIINSEYEQEVTILIRDNWNDSLNLTGNILFDDMRTNEMEMKMFWWEWP